jgi:hypothetical protein
MQEAAAEADSIVRTAHALVSAGCCARLRTHACGVLVLV